MTIGEALRRPGIDPIDAELLLAHALKKPREFLLAHPEGRIRPAQRRRFRASVARRRKHEPVALIIGHKHFYDLTLAVARGVLVPRPETELLIDAVLQRAGDAEGGFPAARTVEHGRVPQAAGPVRVDRTRAVRHRFGMTIIDVGTGSGAIALALAKHVPTARVVATDLSPAALRLAKRNARSLGLAGRVRFLKADLLPDRGVMNHAPTLIVANLPYLPTAVWRSAPPDVRRYEPRSALDGGRDGLDAYRALFARIAEQGVMDHAPTTIIIEIDPTQKRLLPKAVKASLPDARVGFRKDLAGRWRVAVIAARSRSPR